MCYKHLNIDEREVILKMQASENSYSQIAENLGRHKGTISRELSRNMSSTGQYKPHLAQRYYENRRAESKHPYRLEEDKRLRSKVRCGIRNYWSPEQISSQLKQDCDISISPVTIYSWIYRDRTAGGNLYKFLRQSHRRRRYLATTPANRC